MVSFAKGGKEKSWKHVKLEIFQLVRGNFSTVIVKLFNSVFCCDTQMKNTVGRQKYVNVHV